MQLVDLVGKHQLDAVDFLNEITDIGGGDTQEAQVVRFRLDGTVYIAKEDPHDGYRSCLGSVNIGGNEPMANVFPAVAVTCRHRTQLCNIIEFVDDATQKVVLEIGTDESDDYYPYFVGRFHPEEMVSNQRSNASM